MSHSNRQALLEQGFFKVEQLFSHKEMEELRLKSEAVLFRTSNEHRERYKSNGSLCNLAELPEYASLLGDIRLRDVIQKAGGEDIRWTSGYLISKPPGGSSLFWHQDWWGWDADISYEAIPAQLFIMIYLTDTCIENGCLRVIPGSHRHDHELHRLPAAHSKAIATEVVETDPIYAPHQDEQIIDVKRGDIVVGDSRLLHGAYANKTQAERPLLTLWFIPNWQALPENIQATLQATYRREIVDIDDGKEGLITPDAWPQLALEKIAHLRPDYAGMVKPLKWNRLPNTNKLLAKRI